jgi:MYXO-CTERM domain-containing protein
MRRLLAVAIVVGSMVGTAFALQIWPQSSGAQSNPSIPVSAGGRVVFSIRNDSTSSITVTDFQQNNVAPTIGCANQNEPIPLSGTFPVTIAAGAQAQFISTLATGYSSAGDYSCTYDVILGNASSTPPTVPITYHVVAMEDFELQPTVMSFGDQASGNLEQQTAVLTGYGSAQSVSMTIVNDTTGNFELVGCGSSTACTVSSSGGGGTNSVQVRCNASTLGSATATLRVTATILMETMPFGPAPLAIPVAVNVADTTLYCNAYAPTGDISLSPDPLTITAAPAALGSANIMVNGTGSATAASITGYPQFSIAGCGSSCSLALALPNVLEIDCTPSSITTMATLTVTHALTGSAMATVFCTPNNTPGSLFVDTTAINFGSIAVGDSGSGDIPLHIANVGGSPLTGIAITFPGVNGGHYYAAECTSTSACTLDESGGSNSTKDVTIYFQPLVHGPLDSSLQVSANGSGSAGFVNLNGTGLGGVMVVELPPVTTTPTPHLELGTIPIGQVSSDVFRLRNTGNALYTAMFDQPTAPYTVTPLVDAVPETMTRDFTVSCSSATPSANNDQTWTITSDAYLGSAATVTVSCAIANTTINVNPLAFDFGEVRVGSPPQEMTVTVTNPATSSAAAVIKNMRLHEARTGLSLVPPVTTDLSLAVGASTSAVIRLETAEDSDLAGEMLDIDVDNANLELPVRGKVVTPHSRVVPARLDLGTACLGSQVTGTLMLINDGTATLGVSRPEMSGSFLAATPGSLFPLSLPPSMSVTAEVSPAVSANGALEGMLTWQDDVPTLHEIPVILEYVSSGTALSPRALDFGIVAVDMPATSQRLNLENCDADPSKITVKSLRGMRGPIGAWVIEPKVGWEKQLGSHEKQAVNVSFKPPARGRYEAELQVQTRDGMETVLLVGEATGRDFDETSFYTCACSTPGAPWGAWPLPLAVAVLIVRRRRGSSSSR